MSTHDEIRVEIACASDAAYLRPLAAMVRSAVVALRARGTIGLHVLDAGIGSADRTLFSNFCIDQGISIDWYPVAPAAVADLPLWGRMSPTTYQRLLLARYLPVGLSRVIWLDCDLVVRSDLARLWEIDLGGAHVHAVQDILVPTVGSRDGIRGFGRLGLPSTAKYFNAGVMVVDLDRWRHDDIAGRATEYLRDHAREVVFWDQEALNVVLCGRWGELDQRWNQNASVTGRPFFTQRHLDADTYARLVQDPWIVHFSGNLKPWRLPAPARGARAQFFEHLDATPWAGWRPPETITTSLIDAYESSKLRNLLYPTEAWAMRARRRTSMVTR